MDLLKEAKKSNKDAFLSLVDKYSTIFYKIARVYFVFDKDIYQCIETSLSTSYKELKNMKTERDFLCKTIKTLVADCEELEKKLEIGNNKNDDEDFDPSKNTKYRMYKSDSLVEKCITSVDKKYRLVALLYFYADLSINEISSITGFSKKEVTNRINYSKNNIFDTLDREDTKNMGNNQDEYIKASLQKDKISDQNMFDRFANHIITSKLKVSSFTIGKQIFIVIILILIIIGLSLYILNYFFDLSKIFTLKPSTPASTPSEIVDNTLEENTTVENIIENTTLENTITENIISNNILTDTNTVTNEITNVINESGNTAVYANVVPDDTSRESNIDIKELQSFVEEFAIGLNRISLTDESLESNTILLYIARHYFDTHTSKYSIDYDDTYAPTSANIHKYLKEFTGKDYSRVSYIKSYNNYVGYVSTSDAYVTGKDIKNISKEKYTVSDVTIENEFNNLYTAKAIVTRTLDGKDTVYKITFKFSPNNTYSYQKFCLKDLKVTNTSTQPDNTLHLVNVDN